MTGNKNFEALKGRSNTAPRLATTPLLNHPNFPYTHNHEKHRSSVVFSLLPGLQLEWQWKRR
jgi:hypothetical protein